MKELYHDLITKKSFEILKEFKKKFNFILIGGWAVYFYAKTLKSKDIDIIVDYNVLGEIKKEYEVFKNQRLKKYEIKIEGVDIDIYLPFFSKLSFPVEEIKNYTHFIEGFEIPFPEVLLILKIKPCVERIGSLKGRKDLLDIFSLLSKEIIDWNLYKKFIKRYSLQNLNEEFKKIIISVKSLPELRLSCHFISKLKKSVLNEIEKIH